MDLSRNRKSRQPNKTVVTSAKLSSTCRFDLSCSNWIVDYDHPCSDVEAAHKPRKIRGISNQRSLHATALARHHRTPVQRSHASPTCLFQLPTEKMSTGYFPKREKVGLEDLFSGLVTASHILHRHDVLDAYGHISVRSPDNAATFWMPCNMPPALVSSPDDLVEYHVESAEPVEKNAKPGYLERHIHSEIYKRFPGVNSVVHSHAGDVLPYCVSGVPLKNTIHMAGFLGRCACLDLMISLTT